MKQIKLTIPQVPLSENKIRGLMWTDYGKVQLREIRDLWFDEVSLYCRGDVRLFERLPLKKAKLTIKIYFRTVRRRDTLNYPCKEVIDALVENNFIIDDNFDVIGRPNIDITGIDKKHPRTIIEIKEIK